MTDQGSEAANQTEGEAPEVTETQTEAVDVKALQEQLAAAMALVDELKGDNAKYRQQRREAKEANEAAMKKAGEYEPLLQERDSTIAELQAKLSELEPEAKAHRDWLKAERAAIATLANDLDDADKAIVANLPLEQQRAAITRLGGSKAKERPPEHPAANPSPPSTDPSAIPAGIAKSDPGAFAKIKEGLGIPAKSEALPFFAKR